MTLMLFNILVTVFNCRDPVFRVVEMSGSQFSVGTCSLLADI